jgi:hypothetical protein
MIAGLGVESWLGAFFIALCMPGPTARYRSAAGMAGYFRFRRYSGHGRTCRRLDPVANDPFQTSSEPASFDHLVGAEQKRWWDRQPNCLCSFHVDDQLELDRQIDWDLARLRTFEDLVYVTSRAAIEI